MHEPGAPELSVVVPTLNEADWIGATLERARTALGPGVEIVVADGGSADRTREIAGRVARVVESSPGRGRQLNRGLRASRAPVVLFLHADTRLEEGAREAILGAVEDGAELGCHRFGVHPAPSGVGRWRLLEGAVNLRTRVFRTATGDQAIFATRSLLRRVGGVPDQPLFEDVALVSRCRRAGARLRVLPTTARTSRRRWEASGFLSTVLLHWALRLGYALRIPPRRLAEWYREYSAGGAP